MLRTPEEINVKINELNKQRDYLYNFLSTLYKNQHPKEYINKQLMIFDREIKTLEWVLDSDLPY